MPDIQSAYPGELATPDQIRLLADEYRKAASLLEQHGRPREPLSHAPFRLSAIQAIELYLNAFLLHRGHQAKKVRGLQHNLKERTKLAVAEGLKLRAKTEAHLVSMGDNREYLLARYGPEARTASQVNRLTASLEEVAKKVTSRIRAA